MDSGEKKWYADKIRKSDVAFFSQTIGGDQKNLQFRINFIQFCLIRIQRQLKYGFQRNKNPNQRLPVQNIRAELNKFEARANT